MSGAALGSCVACGQDSSYNPRARNDESHKPVEGYTARQDTARSLWRYHTYGRRERSDQVGTEKLGEHQSAPSRARRGRNHQRTKDHQVLGLLGRPHGYPDEHRREKPRMSMAPRNFHAATMVPADNSVGRSLRDPACTQTGERAETSPRETRKE